MMSMLIDIIKEKENCCNFLFPNFFEVIIDNICFLLMCANRMTTDCYSYNFILFTFKILPSKKGKLNKKEKDVS